MDSVVEISSKIIPKATEMSVRCPCVFYILNNCGEKKLYLQIKFYFLQIYFPLQFIVRSEFSFTIVTFYDKIRVFFTSEIFAQITFHRREIIFWTKSTFSSFFGSSASNGLSLGGSCEDASFGITVGWSTYLDKRLFISLLM